MSTPASEVPLKPQPSASEVSVEDEDQGGPKFTDDFFSALKKADYECVIRPQDASAGKLDQDEVARLVCGGAVFFAALLLIFWPPAGISRDLTVGAGIPMITTAATIAVGKGGKK